MPNRFYLHHAGRHSEIEKMLPMMKIVNVKKLVTALALATIVASPAFAKSHHSGSAAAAMAGPDPYTVIVNGEVVGRDPDPNVRLSLMRDPGLQAD
jgi:sarcosine oxidase gamma subunit